MSLENGKRYGAPVLQQSLLDKSKDRLAAVTPHQVCVERCAQHVPMLGAASLTI